MALTRTVMASTSPGLMRSVMRPLVLPETQSLIFSPVSRGADVALKRTSRSSCGGGASGGVRRPHGGGLVS